MNKSKKSIVLFCSLVFMTRQSYAFSPKEHFQKKCISCHSIGGGAGKGPDLMHVFVDKKHGPDKVKKHSTKWLLKFISYPDGMIHGDSSEPGYKKPNKHALALFKHFKKKVMDDVEMSDGNKKALLKYIEKMAKQVKSKKIKPIKK